MLHYLLCDAPESPSRRLSTTLANRHPLLLYEVIDPRWSVTPTLSVAAEGDDEYQKLDSPEGSLNRFWPDNSSASPVNSDSSSNLVPTDGPTTDFEEIPGQ
ncbi:hypothetical protein SCLCIDRAFT_1216727 [Scleroderma citrinum Foug A]|uniref:Uncharacterized protein n=1 Tax=Scleroderma citrinum Foug A TaxID=1036808 RepID=A0A0C3DX15_9AGAM|nr:hypothetical protein SCLCIDRAFT_1216727 [Scleroderma citrinum Foug A]